MGKGGFKGDYSAPAMKSSTIRGSFMRTDSSGVADGLSSRRDLDSENLSNYSVNNEVDPVTGNPRQAVRPYTGTSVSEKGNSFNIC